MRIAGLAAAVAAIPGQALHVDGLRKSTHGVIGNVQPSDDSSPNSGSGALGTSAKLMSMISGHGVLLLVCCVIIVLLAALALFIFMLGPVMKTAIERLDQNALGVAVVVGSTTINIWSLQIDISDLKVHNPDDRGYMSDFLLEVNDITVDLSVWEFVRTLGKRVVVERLSLNKIYATVEKHSLFNSNIKEVLESLDAQKRDILEAEASMAMPMSPKSPKYDRATQEMLANRGFWRDRPKFKVHEVRVSDLSLRFQAEGQVFGQEYVLGAGQAIRDLVYSNNDKLGESTLDFLAAWLLRTVLRTIMNTIEGQQFDGHVF